jgi:hypothetical protein
MASRTKSVRSSFGHSCVRYGVRLRNWTGRGPRSGGVQARAVKGNRCKLDEIDALGMFHLANPDAVSFVLSQI